MSEDLRFLATSSNPNRSSAKDLIALSASSFFCSESKLTTFIGLFKKYFERKLYISYYTIINLESLFDTSGALRGAPAEGVAQNRPAGWSEGKAFPP